MAEGRPFYRRVAVLGLLLFALAPVIWIVANLVLGETGMIGVLAVFLVIPLVIAGLVWRFGSWALILAAVIAALLLLLLLGFGLTYSLTHPESFADFVPALVGVVGLLMTLGGSITAFIQARRRSAHLTAGSVERGVLTAVLVAIGALAIVSAVATVMGRSGVSAEARAGATAVQTKQFQFAPGRLEARAGETTRLVVSNVDATLHTFTIKELGIDQAITPGNEHLIELRAASAGTYTYYCAVPGHEAMKGTLEVR
jgi:uncharacterized cupredoxin-like copper-binding protein